MGLYGTFVGLVRTNFRYKTGEAVYVDVSGV